MPAVKTDLHNNVEFRRAISPVVVSDNTPLVSEIILKQGFSSLEFIIATGTLADADATFTALVEHRDGADAFVAVPDSELLGTEALASFTFADDDAIKKIGYVGKKESVRLTITPALNAGSAPISAVAALGSPSQLPVT